MKKIDQVNVIPFIDVLLVLLAIILVASSFDNYNKLNIILPESNESIAIESSKENDIITINVKGEIFYKNKNVSLEELDSILSKKDKQKNFILEVDKNSLFNNFVQVTEKFHKHKLYNISILSEGN